jgi:hypothetical protein
LSLPFRDLRHDGSRGAKARNETLRDKSRAALDQYRQTVFPAYEMAINTYLQKFNAGFQLGKSHGAAA